MMEMITPATSISYLRKMGITTLTDIDDNINLALGGLDKGISPLEMAGAYTTLSNDGKYIEPTFYTKVEDSNYKTVLKTSQKKNKIISKQTAFIIKKLLTEPVKGKNGTATYCDIPNIEVSAKTGTTNENFDRWLCGFTPYYTAVTWYGYDLNETIEYDNKNPAGLIWANVMKNIHSKLEEKNFGEPHGIVKAEICTSTNALATSNCKNTYTEYFLKGTLPSSCTEHTGSPQKVLETNTTKTEEFEDFIEKKTDEIIDKLKNN